MHVHFPKPLHGWRAFAGEVGIIVIGVLIALTAEQIVHSLHDRQLAREARSDIQSELRTNLRQTIDNQASMAAQERQLQRDLSLLDSSETSRPMTTDLKYEWKLDKAKDSAWKAARLNGSLPLIRPQEVAQASFFYESENATDPAAYGYFTDMDAAEAIADQARAAGTLPSAMREQLIVRTTSALGRCRMLLKLLDYERKALAHTDLVRR